MINKRQVGAAQIGLARSRFVGQQRENLKELSEVRRVSQSGDDKDNYSDAANEKVCRRYANVYDYPCMESWSEASLLAQTL
jgi:hypothetical protein